MDFEPGDEWGVEVVEEVDVDAVFVMTAAGMRQIY